MTPVLTSLSPLPLPFPPPPPLRMTTARLARELADKSSLRAAGVREKYQLFGSLTTEGSVYEAAQYEDEYDDTYDDGTTGQEEPKEETEEDR